MAGQRCVEEADPKGSPPVSLNLRLRPRAREHATCNTASEMQLTRVRPEAQAKIREASDAIARLVKS